jgi:pimeloyl-ACP methyl ester carboxylesterase
MTERAGPRTLENAKAWMHDKLSKRVHPLGLTDPVVTASVIDRLDGLDGERWAAAWGTAGARAHEAGQSALAKGDRAAARDHFMQAYGLFFLGRFPCPNHPAKLECYRRERESYVAAGQLFEQPLQRIVVPFNGRAGEGKEVVFYYCRPAGVPRPQVVVMWGGVDAWKEEMTEASNQLLARGLATVALDNVGTGESPVVAVPDAERQFLPVLDWIAAQPDLDGARPAILGRSFGGYWATKLAHLFPERFSAAVSWGGGAHFMFQRDWVEASRHPESYLMELVETRSRMLGAANDQEYIDAFARLSLLDQGVLDRPCAPLLLVNGKDDRQCPIADIHLLFEHGSPKAVRLFPGGHMGFGPHTVPTIVAWLESQMGKSAHPKIAREHA